VTPTDIVDELWTLKKIRVDRRKIGTDPIKRIGRYSVPVELFQDVTVEVQTHVVPEGGELPPDEELEAMEAAERAEQEAAEQAKAEAEAEYELVDEAEEEQPPASEPEAAADAAGDEPTASTSADDA
jgi:hypothetical protein